MVLLGCRQSISSVLRGYLFPRKPKRGGNEWSTLAYDQVVYNFGKEPAEATSRAQGLLATTACYLCFSNGLETTVVEKDRVSAKVRSDSDFIVVTNNDDQPEDGGRPQANPTHEPPGFAASLAEIVHEAIDRKQCAEHNWHNMKVARAKERRVTSPEQMAQNMETVDVITLVQKYPTTNEATHFTCVMDPQKGRIVWCRRWMRSVSAKWIRSHQSDTW